MSQLFGPVRQMGFVVRDMDRALRYWTETLGVGPFFVSRKNQADNYRYRGKPSTAPLLSVALTNSGDLQIELIQQLDEAPSVYKEFLYAGREGFQHLSSWVRRTEYDAVVAKALAAGAVIAHEGSINNQECRFAYFATDLTPGGAMFEVSEVMEPKIYGFAQSIADAARNWDGRDPVREMQF